MSNPVSSQATAAAATKAPSAGLALNVARFQLACGARLIVSRRPGATVTAIQVRIVGGPSIDAPGFEGTAHLCGSLIDQGTKRWTHDEMAELLEPVGGDVQGNAAGVQAVVAGKRWELLLEVLAEQLLAPTFPKVRVDRQKERVLERLAVELEDPRVKAARGFRRMIYGEHWLGRPAWGTPESVGRIESKHLRAHHRKNWVACRAIITVCGDIAPKKVAQKLDELLSEWSTGKPLARNEATIPEPARRLEVFPADRRQIHVFLGHLGIRRMDPDYVPLTVMDHVLGTGPGFTNRISRRLRDELGLAYSVYADIHSSGGRLPGTFTGYIGTSPEHLETAMQGFAEEINLIRDKRVPKKELELAKSYLLGSFVLGFERAASRAGYLSSAAVHGFPDDYLQKLPAEFAAVTAADVQRVARKHLHPDRCCYAVAGPVTKKDVERAIGK